MILYLSSATAYPIYDDLYEKGLIYAGYQAQKFNHTLIKGLSNFDKLVSVSALPYVNVKTDEIRHTEENVDFYSIKNSRGFFRKFTRLWGVKKLAEKIIKKERPDYIICDAIVAPASYATIKLGKKYKIPTVAIVTDVPQAMVNGGIGGIGGYIIKKYLEKYDYYVLLTKDMNEVVNKKGKPFVVMEGVCDPIDDKSIPKANPKTLVYTGSLWKKEAGLEYFTEGFINADIPNAELHFYGTGEWVEPLKEIEKQNPSVKYKGVLTNKEILEIQRKATLLINPRPSKQEFTKYSFPSKTFEYMASGTPVLMTRLKGVPDEYFNYVYAIEDETSVGVEKTLKEIFSKPDDELFSFGKKAKEFVETNKNKLVQAKKILNFLKENEK